MLNRILAFCCYHIFKRILFFRTNQEKVLEVLCNFRFGYIIRAKKFVCVCVRVCQVGDVWLKFRGTNQQFFSLTLRRSDKNSPWSVCHSLWCHQPHTHLFVIKYCSRHLFWSHFELKVYGENCAFSIRTTLHSVNYFHNNLTTTFIRPNIEFGRISLSF